MTTELINPKAVIDATQTVASAQSSVSDWTRRGTPVRVLATSDVTLTVDSWDFVSGTPSNSSLAEVILLDTANTDVDLPSVKSNLGRVLTIRNIGSTSSDINAASAEEIDTTGAPAATYALAADASVTLVAAEVLGGTASWYAIG